MHALLLAVVILNGFGLGEPLKCFDDNKGKLVACKPKGSAFPYCDRQYGEPGGCNSGKSERVVKTLCQKNKCEKPLCCCTTDGCNEPFTKKTGPLKCYAGSGSGHVEKTCLHGQICALGGVSGTAECIFPPVLGCKFRHKCTEFFKSPLLIGFKCCCKTNLCNPPPKSVGKCYQQADGNDKMKTVVCKNSDTACYRVRGETEEERKTRIRKEKYLYGSETGVLKRDVAGCTADCPKSTAARCEDLNPKQECCCTSEKCNGPPSEGKSKKQPEEPKKEKTKPKPEKKTEIKKKPKEEEKNPKEAKKEKEKAKKEKKPKKEEEKTKEAKKEKEKTKKKEKKPNKEEKKPKKPKKEKEKTKKEKKPKKEEKKPKKKEESKEEKKPEPEKKPEKEKGEAKEGCVFRNVGLLTMVTAAAALWNRVL